MVSLWDRQIPKKQFYDGSINLIPEDFSNFTPLYENVPAIYREGKQFFRVKVSNPLFGGTYFHVKFTLVPTPGMDNNACPAEWHISLSKEDGAYFCPGQMGNPQLSLAIYFGAELVESVVRFCSRLPVEYTPEHGLAIMRHINSYLVATQMATHEQLSFEEASQLLVVARKVRSFPSSGSDGWSISEVDPVKLVNVFHPLKVSKSMILRAYQRRSGGSTKSFIYAVPKAHAVPSLDWFKEHDSNDFQQPPEPPNCFENAMIAIEGDGSLRCYILASLLYRELQEFGATGDGCGDWSTHKLFAPESPIKEALAKEALRRDSIEYILERGQKEMDNPPESPSVKDLWDEKEYRLKDWRPTAIREDTSIAVCFYTQSSSDPKAIYRHLDIYKAGSFDFGTVSSPIEKPGTVLPLPTRSHKVNASTEPGCDKRQKK